MKRIIQLILYGHIHKWKVLKEEVLEKTNNGKRIGYLYVLQCEHCGEMKEFITKV